MEWQDYHLRKSRLSDFWKQANLIALESSLPKDSFLPYICGSFGDIYGVLLLLDSFVEVHDKDTFALIDKNFFRLAERFSRPGLSFGFLEPDLRLRRLLGIHRGSYMLRPGEIYPTLTTLHPLVAEAILTRRLSIVEAWRLILDLPKAAPLKINQPTPSQIAELALIKAYLQSFKRPTVCLFPGNQSNSGIPCELFRLLVGAIRAHGWEPVLNMTGTNGLEEYNDLSLATLNVSPHLLVETCEIFDAVVTTASGVSAVLGMLPNKARVVVIRASSNITKVSYRSYGYILKDVGEELGEDFIKTNDIRDLVWPSERENWKTFIQNLLSSLTGKCD